MQASNLARLKLPSRDWNSFNARTLESGIRVRGIEFETFD